MHSEPAGEAALLSLGGTRQGYGGILKFQRSRRVGQQVGLLVWIQMTSSLLAHTTVGGKRL
jgi:hypothetical protein